MRNHSGATADAERSAAVTTILRMLVTVGYRPRWHALGISPQHGWRSGGNLPWFVR